MDKPGSRSSSLQCVYFYCSLTHGFEYPHVIQNLVTSVTSIESEFPYLQTEGFEFRQSLKLFLVQKLLFVICIGYPEIG